MGNHWLAGITTGIMLFVVGFGAGYWQSYHQYRNMPESWYVERCREMDVRITARQIAFEKCGVCHETVK